MALVLQYDGLQYGKLPQIQVKLKYKLQDAQRIKIDVDIRLGHLPQLDQRMMYLGCGLLIVL
jgi:hypothetical protein